MSESPWVEVAGRIMQIVSGTHPRLVNGLICEELARAYRLGCEDQKALDRAASTTQVCKPHKWQINGKCSDCPEYNRRYDYRPICQHHDSSWCDKKCFGYIFAHEDDELNHPLSCKCDRCRARFMPDPVEPDGKG